MLTAILVLALPVAFALGRKSKTPGISDRQFAAFMKHATRLKPTRSPSDGRTV